MTRISGSRCVVTGAARGIGKLLAQRLLEDGARVALLDLDEETLEKTRAQLSAIGDVRAYTLDVSDGPSIYEVCERILSDMKGIDLLVNNAGIVTGGPLTEVSDERHTLTFAVNVLGVVRMTRALLPSMMERRQGHIVNIASAAGLTGVALQTTYSSSKWAVVGFSESLHYELRHLKHPIPVTCICPGYIDTGMFDGVEPPMLMPMLKPERVVERIMRAIRDDERQVMMPFVVGGVPLLRAALPGRVQDFITEKLGVSKSMEGWRGHD